MKRYLKIGILLDTFPDLSEVFILNHITGLIDFGHEITIFAGQRGKTEKIHPDVEKYKLMDRTIYLPMQEWGVSQLINFPQVLRGVRNRPELLDTINPFRYGMGVFRLRAANSASTLQEGQMDILHCHYGHIGWAFLSLRGVLGVPMVTSFHGNEFKRYHGLGRYVYSKLFQQTDAIIANGLFSRERIKKLGCPEKKIIEIPVCVNDIDLKPRKDILSKKPFEILTVARLDEAKGVQYALHAIANIRERGYDVRHTVIGDGPWKAKLESMAELLGIADVVRFTGWQDQGEVFENCGKSDVFVLASIENRKFVETQGLVIQEAQMHGLVVVASNTGGIPQSVNNGAAGLLFDAGNAEDLSAKLQILLDHPDFARTMAHAGMEYSKKRYSKEVTTSRMVALYNSILSS